MFIVHDIKTDVCTIAHTSYSHVHFVFPLPIRNVSQLLLLWLAWRKWSWAAADVKHSLPVGVSLLSNLLAFCLGESSNNIFWNLFTIIDSAYTLNTQMSSFNTMSRPYPELLVAIVTLDLKTDSVLFRTLTCSHSCPRYLGILISSKKITPLYYN